ncbi:helix-turn-helix domain-containing protein [Klebsiella oxytoca]|uniref:helix-turn-helix domain-containing protein n=1 Tax=Klebsiella oxytoca TaxID=571 RepID=UPI0019195ED5|nr:helix-turn-helix domain-containing protein [Klebsiella oxytoca]HAT1590675.1 helix-turn-helix domain-containing protein [Klebsiella oxytoca]HCD7239045.1 helix-turn-helix domain-containing protein [Klebsiella oxytoca]
MSMSLMVQAMKARVGNPLRKLVLIKLADNASDSGECWPAVATIAFECEISERSVQNHIKQLVADGFVRVEERRGANGVNRSNIYHLSFNNDGANPAPYQNGSISEGANAAPYGASPAPQGANGAGGEGASPAPRTSQLLDPVIESKDPPLPPKGKSAGKKFDPLLVKLPEWLPRQVWSEWVAYRRQLQKPIKTQYGVTGAINKLEEFRRQGYTPMVVISHSMANEYRGLFAPPVAPEMSKKSVIGISTPDAAIPTGFKG